MPVMSKHPKKTKMEGGRGENSNKNREGRGGRRNFNAVAGEGIKNLERLEYQ